MEHSQNIDTVPLSGVRRCDKILALIDEVDIEPVTVDHHQERLDGLREFSSLAWWKVGQGEITASECEEAVQAYEAWVSSGSST